MDIRQGDLCRLASKIKIGFVCAWRLIFNKEGNKKSPNSFIFQEKWAFYSGGSDEARTRDLWLDRPAFYITKSPCFIGEMVL